MASTKEATVIIFDVGPASDSSKTSSEIDPSATHEKPENAFFYNAKKCINRILQRKIFSAPNDEVGLLLMGAPTTDNHLNSAHDGYLHICEAFDVQCTSWHMLRTLETQIERGSRRSDWLDAVVVALDMLNRHSAKKIKTFKIVLVTSFQNSNVDDESYSMVVQQLKEMRIDLVVITDQLCNESTAAADATPCFRKTIDAPSTEMRSKELIVRLVSETDGVMCDFEQALLQLIYFEKKKQRTMPWNAQLEIGTQIKINVAAYIRIKDDNVLKWKTDSRLTTKYWLGDKELSVDAQNDLIKGYMYGSEAIPCDPTLTAYANQTVKCLRCIGFVKQSSLLQQHFAGTGSWTVVAQQKGYRTVSERMFEALVAALRQADKVAIVRYVYRAGLKPKVMALLPVKKDAEADGSVVASLTMLELIYKDNITALEIPSLRGKKTEPNDEQYAAVDALIDAMDLMDSVDTDDGDDGTKTEAFAYTKLLNPTLQHVYRVISHRALNPMQPIPPIDTDLTDRIDAPAKVKASAVEPLKAIRALFPLEPIVKETNAKLFAKLNAISSAANPTETVAETNVLPDGLKLVTVGTVTPAEDFAELLHRGERFSDLCDQMANVIRALVLQSADVKSAKLGRAIMMFREEAKMLGPHRYNQFVEDFRDMLAERHQSNVWQDIVVRERFGLISNTESMASAVTDQEADEFYEKGNRNMSALNVTRSDAGADDEDDNEGLLDLM